MQFCNDNIYRLKIFQRSVSKQEKSRHSNIKDRKLPANRNIRRETRNIKLVDIVKFRLWQNANRYNLKSIHSWDGYYMKGLLSMPPNEYDLRGSTSDLISSSRWQKSSISSFAC